MVVLKKIKASTLMETLVASVLIVVVFMIASMILNNLFSNTIKSNTRLIDAHLNELEYFYKNGKLSIPYYDDFNAWEIEIELFKERHKQKVLLKPLIEKHIKLFQKKSMSTNSKIKAFTLSEMVVVLILTSVVIGLAFLVLTLVQKHMLGIRTNFKHQSELSKLEQSLWLDIHRFSRIEFNAMEDVITFKNNIDSVNYHFNEKHIIKDIDTFNIQLEYKTLFFDGDKVDKGEIDAIKLETSEEFQNQILFVIKENDASYFVNHGI